MATKKRNSDRLPPITPELVIETVGLEIQRDEAGMVFCRDRGIGPRRRKLGPAPLYFAPPAAELERYIEVARDGARVVLAEMCRVCPFGECEMKKF